MTAEIKEIDEQVKLLLKKKKELEKEEKEKPKEVVILFSEHMTQIFHRMRLVKGKMGESIGITRSTITKLTNKVSNYYPHLRSLFIKTIFKAAEKDDWECIFLLVYHPDLFKEMMDANDYAFRFPRSVKIQINKEMKDSMIPFGDYKIPQKVFELMMKV